MQNQIQSFLRQQMNERSSLEQAQASLLELAVQCAQAKQASVAARAPAAASDESRQLTAEPQNGIITNNVEGLTATLPWGNHATLIQT